MKRTVLGGLSTIALLGLVACAETPTRGDQIRGYSAANDVQASINDKLADSWEKGDELSGKGNDKIKRGEKLVENGERDIKKGKKLIKEGRDELGYGKKLMNESEVYFDERYQTKN